MRSLRNNIIFVSILTFWAIFMTSQGLALAAEVTPSDVFASVTQLREELDLIRLEMGKPLADPTPFNVVGAAPRHVIFQAVTLCLKSGQLLFEWTRQNHRCPEPVLGEVVPVHVLQVVNVVLQHLAAIKERFDIPERGRTHQSDELKTPTDVFMAIVEASRQLNILLNRRFSPDDVFQRLTLSIHYAAQLAARFPEIEVRIPPEESFVRRKTPSDVFQRLVVIFNIIQRMATISGIPILDLQVNTKVLATVTPSDVHDIAALIGAELSHLYWLSGQRTVLESYRPPPRIPAHVFQRAGILESQLQTLLKYIEVNSSWLKDGN